MLLCYPINIFPWSILSLLYGSIHQFKILGAWCGTEELIRDFGPCVQSMDNTRGYDCNSCLSFLTSNGRLTAIFDKTCPTLWSENNVGLVMHCLAFMTCTSSWLHFISNIIFLYIKRRILDAYIWKTIYFYFLKWNSWHKTELYIIQLCLP